MCVAEIKCHRLNVTVEKGENVRKGRIRDLMDTPDPYVELLVKGIPKGNPKTKTIDNTINPEWNESFTFYLDPSKEYNLDVALFDENVGKDELIGRQTINLKHLKPNENVAKILEFGKKSKIYLKLLLEEDWVPDLRYSTDLSDQEKVFLGKRKEYAFKAIKQILRPDISPNNVEEVCKE
ncbi:hypothetical protein J437_LFUL002456 [Ladona fulva]|uniref:C2 domain-containing protein n=1 Tax=Ladona fulva TaxID=123851 RepID=A0A8K0P986_LADFU|nr:hypothetical protein J437_LFUL002456 [Ladona fulva]